VDGRQQIMPRLVDWGIAALPVLAAVLLAALARQNLSGSAEWFAFLAHCAIILVGALPLLAAHFAAAWLGGARAVGAWLTGFVLVPLVLGWAQADSYPLRAGDWILTASFSLVALLVRSARTGRLLLALGRLPVTLDGAIAAFVAIFVLMATSMFASIPDPVNNQPFTVWFDPAHIAGHPLASLGYLAQFAFVGGLIMGFYWCCRQVLVRQILNDYGWVALLLASLVVWILYTPLAASLALLLPLNPSHWSLLPSENHNPFDPLNYAFSAAGWAVFTPLILVSERLLAERSAAIGRHEQARAELHTLHQQINPHFLFNSLNTLYALCLNDRASSAEAIVKLSDLLRYVVYQGSREWVGLDEEIAYLRNYIDLQLLRFGQRCQVTCHWPADPTRFRIPPLLLIMLVENAFKHGVEPVEGESAIDISLELNDAHMLFTCRNQPYDPHSASDEGGVGLTNLRRRLEILFDGDFVLSSAPDGRGWKAVLSLDLRPC
jgi:hypothetical protein